MGLPTLLIASGWVVVVSTTALAWSDVGATEISCNEARTAIGSHTVGRAGFDGVIDDSPKANVPGGSNVLSIDTVKERVAGRGDREGVWRYRRGSGDRPAKRQRIGHCSSGRCARCA